MFYQPAQRQQQQRSGWERETSKFNSSADAKPNKIKIGQFPLGFSSKTSGISLGQIISMFGGSVKVINAMLLLSQQRLVDILENGFLHMKLTYFTLLVFRDVFLVFLSF